MSVVITEKTTLSFKAAEEVFEELLRTGAGEALATIRRRAFKRHITPVQALVLVGDPREEKP